MMHSAIAYFVLYMMAARAILAADLAVITPCPQASNKPDFITVTSQYQPVETCYPTVVNGVPTFTYSTYKYVSTNIPCAIEGTTSSSVLVTDISQWITVTKYPETTKIASQLPDGQNVYETIYKHGLAMFDKMGSLAIPGWQGSGLCDECEQIQDDGSRRQKIRMQECTRQWDWQNCIEYEEIWISTYAPPIATTTYPVCATRSSVSAAGMYTFAFRQPGCTNTVTVPARTVTVSIGVKQYSTRVEPEKSYFVTQPPWYEYITKGCNGPTVFDFTTTVTKTITLLVPYGVQGPTATTTIINPPYTGFPPPMQSYGGTGTGGFGGVGGGDGGGGRPTGTMSTPGSGPFVTLTVTPIGSVTGGSPSTITLATPSGTVPGTVEVIELPTASGPALSFPTGSFVTLTVTAVGPPDGSAPYTITIATPSGNNPGTVEVVNPPIGSTTSTSPGQYVTMTVTPIGGSGGGPPTTITVATPSGSSPGTIQVIGSPSGTATINSPLSSGQYVTETVTPIGPSGGGSPSTITIATPSGTSPGVVEVIDPPMGGTTTGSSSGNGQYTTIVVTPSGSGPSGSLVTSTIAQPSGSSPGTVVISNVPLTSLTSSTAIVSQSSGASSGMGPITVTCVGVLCASLGISAPNAGATVTAVIGGSSGAATGTATGTAASNTAPCVGAICASVGVSDSAVGATVTAVVGGSTGVPSGVMGSTTITCTGLLCASLGISASMAGATVTAVVESGVDLSNTAAISAITNSNGVVILVPASQTGSSNSATCSGALCISASVSVPVGQVSASGVVLPNPTSATTSNGPSSQGAGSASPASSSGAATTTCVGALCVVASVSLPGNQASASAVVLPTSNGAGNTASSTTCSGVLCVSAGASVPVVQASASAVVLPSNGVVVASAGVSSPATPAASSSPAPAGASSQSAAPQSPTAAPQSSAASTPCIGALCASVGASVPVVQASASAVVLPSSSLLSASANVASAGLPASVTLAPSSNVLQASVSATISLVKRSGTPVYLDTVSDETPGKLSSSDILISGIVNKNSDVEDKNLDTEPLHASDHPTTLRTSTMSKATSIQSVDVKSETCFKSVSICSEMNLHSLFKTQRVMVQPRIGRKVFDTADSTLNNCLEDKDCMTYGLTNDGSLGFTSTLSIDAIQDRLIDHMEKSEIACHYFTAINLFSNSEHCLVRRLILEALNTDE